MAIAVRSVDSGAPCSELRSKNMLIVSAITVRSYRSVVLIVAIGVPTKISGETLARSQCVTWTSTELENMSEVIVVAIAA